VDQHLGTGEDLLRAIPKTEAVIKP
jgi:hypothetical protein